MIEIVGGMVVGVLIWIVFMRPMQLNKYERLRRAAGLPPRRKLREDR